MISEEKAAGHLGPDAHPRSRPDLVEAEAIDRLLKIAGLAEAPVIVVHLSTEAGLEEICEARENGRQVFVETCPQYLLLDDSLYQLPDFSSGRYVISPPLRGKENREVLWEAIKEGMIQTVATDHCSFTLAQKDAGRDDFTRIPNGMPGVENRPALIYTDGVGKGRITPEQMCRILSENAAKLYGVYPQKGAIQAGSDADLVVWDPAVSWEISVAEQVSRCDYSPFEGYQVKGRAEKVYLRGVLAAENGKVVQEHQGRYVARKKWMEPGGY